MTMTLRTTEAADVWALRDTSRPEAGFVATVGMFGLTFAIDAYRVYVDHVDRLHVPDHPAVSDVLAELYGSGPVALTVIDGRRHLLVGTVVPGTFGDISTWAPNPSDALVRTVEWQSGPGGHQAVPLEVNRTTMWLVNAPAEVAEQLAPASDLLGLMPRSSLDADDQDVETSPVLVPSKAVRW